MARSASHDKAFRLEPYSYAEAQALIAGLDLAEPVAVTLVRRGYRTVEKARAFLQNCGGTAEGVIKFANETLPSYDLIAKKLELPLAEFEKEFERESAKQAGNPVYKAFFPALVKVRQAKARADVRRALLSAALAVQLDGKDALKDHADPVAGGMFDYVAFEGGFELRSKFKNEDNKPFSLSVGRRGK